MPDSIHSPWRSTYIQSFSDESAEKGCVFCAALKSDKDEENLLVYRGKTMFVLMNRFPYNSGHLLIIPNRHTSAFEELTEGELSESSALLQVSHRVLSGLVSPHGFNIGMNLGRTAGAGIDDHLHWHIVPRWNGDTNFLPVLADVKLVSEDMAAQWRKLHERFPDAVTSRPSVTLRRSDN